MCNWKTTMSATYNEIVNKLFTVAKIIVSADGNFPYDIIKQSVTFIPSTPADDEIKRTIMSEKCRKLIFQKLVDVLLCYIITDNDPENFTKRIHEFRELIIKTHNDDLMDGEMCLDLTKLELSKFA